MPLFDDTVCKAIKFECHLLWEKFDASNGDIGDIYRTICKKLDYTRKNSPANIAEIKATYGPNKYAEFARLMFIGEVLNVIASGQFHRYRGELDFQGQILMNFASKMINDGEELGHLTKQEAQNMRLNFHDAIQDVG